MNELNNLEFAINFLKTNMCCRASSFTPEDAKKIQEHFDDVVWIPKGDSIWGDGKEKILFFHVDNSVITPIETPEHYGFDEDTEYVLYPEHLNIRDSEIFIELTSEELIIVRNQLKELERYDILIKMEV